MKNKPEVIKTPRLLLRNITDDDELLMIEMLNDSLIKKTYMIPDFESEESAKDFFQKLKTLCYKDGYFVYAITLDNKAIGFLNNVSIEDKRIEIGYFISSKHWNKGYASEALQVAIDTLFDMGYEVIEAAHFIENPASGRVMEKCHMHRIDKEETISYRNKEHICLYYEIKKENVK